jgi:hypothetical protein
MVAQSKVSTKAGLSLSAILPFVQTPWDGSASSFELMADQHSKD